MTRDEINAFGELLTAELLDGDEAILVSIGAIPPHVDCDEASSLATVSGYVGNIVHHFTGNGQTLQNSILIARGKLRAARKSHAAALEKAKAEKVSA